MAAVLARLEGSSAGALIAGVDLDAGQGCGNNRAGLARLSDLETLFLVGDRSRFVGLLPKRRMVVLTPDELERASGKFGPTYGYRITLFQLDHEKRRGICIYTAGWKGGTFLLAKQPDGSWSVEVVSGWIT